MNTTRKNKSLALNVAKNNNTDTKFTRKSQLNDHESDWEWQLKFDEENEAQNEWNFNYE